MILKLFIKSAWKDFKSAWYMYKWLANVICYLFGHSLVKRLQVYEQEKIKKIGDKTFVKHRYDPYMVYHCKRCGKHLLNRRIARKLKRDEAEIISRQITAAMELRELQLKQAKSKGNIHPKQSRHPLLQKSRNKK